MHEQSGDGLLGVLHREESAPTARLEDLAAVTELAAALAVERSLIQNDLGLALPGQLLVLHAVANDGNDSGLGLRAVVA